MIILYSKDGLTQKAEIHKFTYNGVFMGEAFLSATISSDQPIDFADGDYCMYRGEKFILSYDPAKQKQARRGTYGEAFVYDSIKFNSLADELTRCEFKDVVMYDNEIHGTSVPEFMFEANSVQDLADRIQANLNRLYKGSEAWTVSVSPDLEPKRKSISVSNIKVSEALQLANSEFGANYIIRGRTITIGTAGMAVGKVFGYGKGNGLYDIQQTTNQDAAIITRLSAYGSRRNIPNRYYNKLKDSNGNPYISEALWIPNLMLPSFPYTQSDPSKVYIDSPNIAKYGIREGSVYFDQEDNEIYPSIEGMTAQQLADAGITVSLPSGDNSIINECLGADNPTDDGLIPEEGSGEIDGQFTIYLKDLGFDLTEKDEKGDYKYQIAGQSVQISMRDGACNARTFDVIENGITKDTSLGYTRFKVICNRFTDDSIQGGTAFPNNQFKVVAGDKFVILGIELPEVYVKAAAQRLLVASQEYLAQNDSTKYTYTPSIDEIFMANNPSIGESLKEGDIFNFTDTDLDIDASVIIQSLKINVGDKLIPTYEVSLSNDKIAGSIEKIQNAINTLASNQTGITLDQVKSLISSVGTKYYLSKIYDDTASGNVNFMQNVSVIKDLLVKGGITSEGKVTSDQFGNETFTSGQFGNGFRTWLAANGQSYAEFDNLMVRREMIINTLTIAEIKSVGGQILLSLANMYCNAVTDGGSYWKCSFDTSNGTIANQFAVDDQVICRKFNGANIKYYWARVTSVGTDYINISKTDKDGSGIPAINDEIIQFGNRTNSARQSAIILSAYGSDAPSFKQYAGINSYDLTGKEVTVISPSGNKFTGDFVIQSSGKNVTTAISEVDTKAGNAQTSANTANAGLLSKVAYSEYNAQMQVLNTQISSKVSQTDFNTLGDRVSTTESSITQQAGQISSVVQKVDNIQIGIRNYVLDSKSKYRTGKGFIVWGLSDEMPLSGKFTLSFNGISTNGGTGGGLGVSFTSNPNGQQESYFWLPSQPIGESNQNITIDLTRTSVQKYICIYSNDLGRFDVNKFSLISGNKKTDWIPAPEDTQSQIDSKNCTYYQDAQPTAPSGGFSVGDIWQKVTYTDTTGVVNMDSSKNVCRFEYRWNGTTWVQINFNVSGSYVTQTNDSISSLVTKTGINSLGTGETLKSLIDQTPDKITLAVSAIQIGGVNKFRNTNFLSSANRSFTPPSIAWLNENRGKQMAISLYINTENAILSGNKRIGAEFSVTFSDGTISYFGVWMVFPDTATTYKGRISRTFTFPDKQVVSIVYCQTFFQTFVSGTANAGYPKLEEGNKSTAWTEAPEDTQSQIDGKTTLAEVASSLSIAANKITLSSKTIELKGDTIADAIEAGQLNVGNGKFKVDPNGDFTSKNANIEGALRVSGNNQITVADANGNTRVIIKPTDITSITNIGGVVAQELVNTGGAAASRSIQNETNIWYGRTFTLAAGKVYDLVIPAISISATVNTIGGPATVYARTVIRLRNTTTYVSYEIASIEASPRDFGGTVFESARLNGVVAGNWRIEIEMMAITDAYFTGTASFTMNSNIVIQATPLSQFTEMGLNGFMTALSSNKYMHITTDGIYMRMDTYILRVTSSGIQKSTNSGSSWTSL